MQEQVLHNVALRERNLLKSVYGWMTGALALTALVAYGVASSPSLMRALVGSGFGVFGLIIAQFALVFFLSARLDTMSAQAAIGAFLLYSVINGVMFSTLFVVYTGLVIYKAFLSAALLFVGMSLYAMTTKKDLSGMGYYLMVSLWGLVIASLMNMFFRSSGMDYIISWVGVLLFTGLTAWDTQKIKAMNASYGYSVDEATYSKLAIISALSLYLDFINIFLYLLRIFGRNRD